MRSATAPAVMVAAAAEKAQWNRNSDQLLSPQVLSSVLDRAKSPVPMKPLFLPLGLSPKARPFLQGRKNRHSHRQACRSREHCRLLSQQWCCAVNLSTMCTAQGTLQLSPSRAMHAGP
jgi:hypothetical protein